MCCSIHVLSSIAYSVSLLYVLQIRQLLTDVIMSLSTTAVLVKVSRLAGLYYRPTFTTNVWIKCKC